MHEQTITFIGAGNMAEAMVRGLLNARLFPASRVRVADVDAQRLTHFTEHFKVTGVRNNVEAAAGADVVVLAVKPQIVREALSELKDRLPVNALVISIAAGVKTGVLESALREGARVIRVMPNTAAWVGKGAAAYCCGRHATEADARMVEALFRAVGIVVRLDEDALDAVTALSGSGPAYVFYLVEAMLTAAAAMGLDPVAARSLVVATVEGAACLLKETGLDPRELRRRVTSKGGTTEAAFKVLQEHRVLESFMAAIHKAHQHSRDLSK